MTGLNHISKKHIDIKKLWHVPVEHGHHSMHDLKILITSKVNVYYAIFLLFFSSISDVHVLPFTSYKHYSCNFSSTYACNFSSSSLITHVFYHLVS